MGTVLCCIEPYIYIQEIGCGNQSGIDRTFRKSFQAQHTDSCCRRTDLESKKEKKDKKQLPSREEIQSKSLFLFTLKAARSNEATRREKLTETTESFDLPG